MTLLPVGRTLLGLVGENGDLLSFTVFDYLSFNCCSAYIGSAYFKTAVLSDSNDFVESNGIISVNVELFNKDLIALFYLILLSSGT